MADTATVPGRTRTTAASSGPSPARQLFFYTLGDVLGSGIYVLIGLVAAAVGGAFWIAFALGVTVAAITGAAYAELVTKYPQAAGASLYVNKAFGNRPLTFLITVSFLAASMAASGSLADRLRVLLRRAVGRPAGAAGLAGLRRRCSWSSTSSASPSRSSINMLMTFVEVSGLLIVLVIGIWLHRPGQRRLRRAHRHRHHRRLRQPGARRAGRHLVLLLRDDGLREHRQRRRGDHRPPQGVPALPGRRHDRRRPRLRPGLDGRRPDGADRRRSPAPTRRCSRWSSRASCRSPPTS